ncbi:hypothetical protein GQ53DRAFT_839941 [Thozetella sp. PMI_491]|nr:hypothetical protein GQ53DRAFT_839941 [Thozetella sp. PMI_491]
MVPGGWVSLFPAVFHGKDNLLNKSLLALYTGFVGRRNGDEGLADLGMQLYADALYQLRTSDLWSPRKKQLDVDAKLASIIVFSRCELFTAQAGGGGYMAHVRGGLELLRRHATRLPRNELSKMIVKKLRILGLYATIRHREPFFMSKEPFSSLYVAEPGDPDYIPQRGFESMAKFPALAKRADELDTRKYTGTKAAMSGQRTAQSLLEAAKTLAENLRSWHSELTAAIPAPKHAFAASTTGHATHGFPTGYLHYAGPGHNYVWMLYWVFALYVNLLIKQLQIRHAQLASLLAEPRSLPSDLAELGISYDTLDEYAENISKSIFGTYHSSALEAQETMAPIFTLQWYYEQRGDAVKIHRCIETIRILEHEGLALDLRVQRAGSIPKARAGFLAELGKGMMPEAEAGILAENSELSLGSKKTQD